MAKENPILDEVTSKDYEFGWVSNIEAESAPKGLNEEIVRFISSKKQEPEWLLEWRLKSFRHWKTMAEPKWPNVNYPAINYQDIIYYSAPKKEIIPNLVGRGRPRAS